MLGALMYLLCHYDTGRASGVHKARESREGWRLGLSGGSHTQLSSKRPEFASRVKPYVTSLFQNLTTWFLCLTLTNVLFPVSHVLRLCGRKALTLKGMCHMSISWDLTALDENDLGLSQRGSYSCTHKSNRWNLRTSLKVQETAAVEMMIKTSQKTWPDYLKPKVRENCVCAGLRSVKSLTWMCFIVIFLLC